MGNNKIWSEVLLKVKDSIPGPGYDAWFSLLKMRKIDKELNIVYLEIDSTDRRCDFAISTLKNRYMTVLENSFRNVLNEDYRVVIKGSDQYSSEEFKQEEAKIKPKKKTIIINACTFNAVIFAFCFAAGGRGRGNRPEHS